MPNGFPGFPKEGLKFLRQLKKNNDREWFQPRKEEFERTLRDPLLALCGSLNAELVKFAPDYVSDPSKSVFRIYRDTRFSKDKTPYKTHVSAAFGNRLLPKGQGSGFYFQLDTEKIGMGGGVYRPEPLTLKTLRTHVGEQYEEFEKVLKSLRAKKIAGKFEGHEMSRVPKGFEPDHPAADLLKCRSWFFYAELPADAALEPGIVREIASRFKALAPLIQFLDRPFSGARNATRKFAIEDMV